MKKILILGAGFLQTFVIRKAKEMGYIVLAVDANPEAEGFVYTDKYAVINIVDEQECLSFAMEEQIDGVLTVATDYGVVTAAYIAQEMNLPGLKYSVAKIIKNKYQTRKCLLENTVDDADQVCEVGIETDISVMRRKINYPVMVKPCDGSGSRGASRVNNPNELQNACAIAIEASITNKAIIETFIVGSEYGVESIVVNGEVHVLGIIKKWMTEPPYYAEIGHAIPSDLNRVVENKAREYVKKAIETLGVNSGAVNMDLLITSQGNIYIIDIGARMGGNLIGSHIIELGTGIDYMAAILCNAVGDEVDLSADYKQAVATRVLTFPEGVIKQVPNIKELEKEYNVAIKHHMKLGDTVNEYRTNLDGCGYVVAVDDNIEAAINKAEVAIHEIRSIAVESGV